MRPDDPARQPLLSRQRALTSSVGLRAERIGYSPEGLLALINDALDNAARRGRGAPARPTSRTLLRSLTEATQCAEEARVRLKAAQDAVDVADRAVAAASEALRSFGGKPPVRP